jgi:hypothetical protein
MKTMRVIPAEAGIQARGTPENKAGPRLAPG